MDYNEQKFRDNYKKEIIDPIDLLIQHNNITDIAAAKLILLGIDSLAGFYVGRTTSGHIERSFIDFVERYMPNFNKKIFTGTSGVRLKNRKTGKEISKPSEILYSIFRNDLIHDGAMGIGVEIYRDDIKILWTGFGAQILRINILGFFEYYKKAIEDYEKDLSIDNLLMKNFSNKYNIVTDFSFDTFLPPSPPVQSSGAIK